MSSARTCLSAIFALTVGATGMRGQEVRGRVVTDEGGRPLASSLVTLVDDGGATRASTLTNVQGWFSLRAPGAGHFLVRAEFIGYSTAETGVDVTGDEPTVVRLVLGYRAIQLEGLTAAVDKACDIPHDKARRVAVLWDEVRKAFRVTDYVEHQATYLFDVDRWTRTLDPGDLKIEDEQRRSRTGMHPGSPFASLAPERLARDGYIQKDEDSHDLRYYAPDARVLLDRSFQDGHCFGFTDKGPEKGWFGLTFAPRDKRAEDIEGTLWIDGRTYQPRRLDYRYPVLPWPLTTDKVGGRIEFARIPEGPWIVRRWRIRMPVVQERQVRLTSADIPRRRYGLASLIEQGGEVRDVKVDGAQALTFDLGSVHGTVVDSAMGAPVAGARVRLKGTYFTGVSDSAGRFAFAGVPAGRYEVSATTDVLSALGAVAPGTRVEVTDGGSATVRIRVPTAVQAVAELCVRPVTEDGDGVVMGRVRDAAGVTVPRGEVALSWDVVTKLEAHRGVDRSGAPAQAVTVGADRMQARVPVRADGTFVVCGAPTDQTLTLQATAPDLASPVDTVRFRGSTFRQLDLVVKPVTMADALVVRVVEPDGRTPLEAAQVKLVELGRSLSTDASGVAMFPKVPAGTLTMEVHHLAYVTRTDTVQVAPSGRTAATVTMSDRSYQLAPLQVEVVTPEAIANRKSGSSGSAAISQVEIRSFIKGARANDVAEVIEAKLGPAVRISPIVHRDNYVGTCIESTRGGYQLRKAAAAAANNGVNTCAMVQVVVDGMWLSTEEAAHLVQDFPLLDIVSMEFLDPMEETFRFGTSLATGMLIITTARGGG